VVFNWWCPMGIKDYEFMTNAEVLELIKHAEKNKDKIVKLPRDKPVDLGTKVAIKIVNPAEEFLNHLTIIREKGYHTKDLIDELVTLSEKVYSPNDKLYGEGYIYDTIPESLRIVFLDKNIIIDDPEEFKDMLNDFIKYLKKEICNLKKEVIKAQK